MKNSQVYSRFETDSSDHKIVTAKLKLSLRANQQKNDKIKSYNWSEHTQDRQLRDRYTVDVRNGFAKGIQESFKEGHL